MAEQEALSRCSGRACPFRGALNARPVQNFLSDHKCSWIVLHCLEKLCKDSPVAMGKEVHLTELQQIDSFYTDTPCWLQLCDELVGQDSWFLTRGA